MKRYRVLLGDVVLGTTELEKADPPMGVAMGRIHPADTGLGYVFLRDYCLSKGITLNIDDREFRCIDTQSIPDLRVVDDNGIEVLGIGSSIGGMDSDGYDVTIIGIAYPFYEEEFPHHVQAYRERFP